MKLIEFAAFFDSLDEHQRPRFAELFLDRSHSLAFSQGFAENKLTKIAIEAFETARNAIGLAPVIVTRQTTQETGPGGFPVARFLELCKHGGFYCYACKRFVDVTEGPDSIRRCDRCQGAKLKWHPPIEGMNDK